MTRISIALEKTDERGGAEVLALKLARHLRKVGFACDILELPRFKLLQPPMRDALTRRGLAVLRDALGVLDMLLSYFTTSLTGLDTYDLIVIMHPTCLYLRHPKTLIYFLHHHRGAYDLYDYLATGLRGFELLGFRLAVRLRRMLDLGTIRYIKKKNIRLVAVSNSVARRLEAFWGIRPDRVIYPGGYEPSFYGLPGEYVLYLGRFDWRVKRLWLVYEAAARLPDLRFIVAVSGIPSQERPPCNLELVVKDGLFTEREKADLYARSYCVLFPAYDEDYGLVPVEAMSAGKPCLVCTDGGGAAEMVINGKTGLVVEPTVQCVVNGVRKLTEMSQSMKEDCIQRAKHFSWDIFLEEMEDEIQTVLGN